MTNNIATVILSVGGHDPSGGAGVSADSRTAAALGCHAVTVLTAVTVQNTLQLQRYEALPPKVVSEQMQILSSDCRIAACKTGMLATAGIVHAVTTVLANQAAMPIVVDPVLMAGAGGPLADDGLAIALMKNLFPLATLATPNIPELRRLTGTHDIATGARALLATGCRHVLVTGTHDDTAEVIHHLYSSADAAPLRYRYPRLPGEYHGSGCTLATALTARLAARVPVVDAVPAALDFTWQALQRAYAVGQGQLIPAVAHS